LTLAVFSHSQGQKRKSPPIRLISPLPPKTDMERSELPYIATTLKVVVRIILW
jgi:hypothetical protein